MLIVYDRLISSLSESGDESVELLTDSLSRSASRCRKIGAGVMEENVRQAMMRQMREELREIPTTLRSLLPGIGPRLCESLESKLGIQFSRF